MLVEDESASQLRKSIYSRENNPQQKKFFLDRLADKIGTQNVAYITMTISNIVFPLGFLYTNQNNFNVCETFIIRSIAVISVNLFIARYLDMDITFRDPSNFKILLFRNFCITIQSIIFTLAQFYLSQPIIHTINSTGSIFVFILDYYINHVTITIKQFYGVILGVFGVLLTINGQLIIKAIDPSYEQKSDFKNYLTNDSWVKSLVGILFILGNIMWAYAQVITKRLHGVNSIQINIHLGIFFMFTTGIFYPTQVKDPVPIQKIVTSLFVGGLLMAFAQITFIGAITMTKNTGILTMFVFVGVIVGYFVSVFKYNQGINPICIFGTLSIILGLSMIVFKGKPKQHQQIKSETENKK